ncbi:MAG: glycoside hydrolase family 3 protein, partial [Lachnospiraceae bacterium]|nr:glycoside hydrolase family 3 protein [Lachnospiraceae bacterium]
FGWYGPAMNTHRSAFAGRNFEYYSEDGVLAGYCAAAEINGAVENLVYPYIKHFALNELETNRCTFLLTFADEQAIREIYLKPFEMAVKAYEGKTLAVMSSFNFIGTRPSTANGNLLNNVLRDEWGFVGMVETDYDGSYGFMYSDHGVRNGNDLMLGFGSAETNQFTDQSATAALAMRQACKNIMYTIVNSGYYTGVESDPADAPDKMVTTFRNVDLGIGAILLLLEALLIRSFLKRRKEQQA